LSLQSQVYELYLLDSNLRGLSKRLDAANRRLRAQEKKLDQIQQQHDEVHDQIQQHTAKTNAAEKLVTDLEAKITSHREQMNSATSHREYSALRDEIENLKAEKSKLEDTALGEMTDLDEHQQKLDDLKVKLTDQQTLVSSAQKEVGEARSEVGDKLDEVQTERNEAAAKLPEDILSTFERLSDAYEGEAMAEIEEQDRRRMEYTCGGCFMSLPIERVNALMTRPNEIVSCNNCNRFLYITPSLKEALAPEA